jgi:hypothetical protein
MALSVLAVHCTFGGREMEGYYWEPVRILCSGYVVLSDVLERVELCDGRYSEIT